MRSVDVGICRHECVQIEIAAMQLLAWQECKSAMVIEQLEVTNTLILSDPHNWVFAGTER